MELIGSVRCGVVACATGLVLASGSAWGQGEPEPLPLGLEVRPLRAAPAVLVDGRAARVGPWEPMGASREWHDLCQDYRIYDCYGDGDWNGYPDGGLDCGLGGDASRWSFGSGFCNPFFTNDMVLADDTILEEGAWRADVAWYWSCAGFDREQCVVAVFTQRSSADLCEPDSLDYAGWMFDFGELDCTPSGYYFAAIDISPLGRWTLPPEGRGSHAVLFLTDDGTSPASCAQPMLWGVTGRDHGSQGPGQLDDVSGDGEHQVPEECFTYAFDLCPDPLGGMVQFWGERAGERPRRADFDGNGRVDSRDVIAFLNAWRGCDFGSDCTGDGGCTSQDVLCFLDAWVSCER